MQYKICTHTRDFNEINQFIDHHLNLGFDKIFIYDNSKITPVVYEHDKVIIINWPHPVLNCNTYNDYLSKFRDPDSWTAFIDEDEFINTKNKSIQDVMSEFVDFDSLGLNWRVFGDRWSNEINSDLLVEKYRYYIPEENEINHHIKTFCRDYVPRSYTNPHAPTFNRGYTNKNTDGKIIGSDYFSIGVYDKLWIDHYHLRGLDNFIARRINNSKIHGITFNLDVCKQHYDDHNLLATKKI